MPSENRLLTPLDLNEHFKLDVVSKKVGLADAVLPQAAIDYMKRYVQSRGNGLITNGYGGMLDNTNFSKFQYVTDDVYAGFGSFSNAVLNAVVQMDEFIAVDPEARYRFQFAIKTKNKVGDSRAYAMLVPYDSDYNEIGPHNIIVTTCRLAAPLRVTDTQLTIHADDRDKFNTQFWNTRKNYASNLYISDPVYQNSSGFQYPRGTYTRKIYTRPYPGTLIKNHTYNLQTGVLSGFTLSNLYGRSEIPAGEEVAFSVAGAAYIYTVSSLVDTVVPETWTAYSKDFVAKEHVRPGTAFVKFGWLLNRNSRIGNKTYLSAIQFKEL